MEKLPHECGVALVCLPGNDADAVPGALAMLRDQRHRGRQGAGLAVPDAAGGFSVLKFDGDNSLDHLCDAACALHGDMVLGHVRYATSGQRTRANAQPMVLHHCKGAMAICHNGNLTNAPQLRHKLEMNGSIFHGTSDTEVIGYLLTQNRLISPDIETAVCRTMEQIVGATAWSL